MSDPPRLNDPGSTGQESLRRLIQAGRSEVPDSERLRSLAGRLGFGVGALPASTGAAKGAATLLGGAGAKMGAVALIALGGAGALVAVHATRARQVVVAAPIAQPAPATASRLPPGLPVPIEEAAETPGDPVPVGPSAAPAPPVAPRLIARNSPAKAKENEPPVLSPTMDPSPVSPVDTEFSLVEQAQRALAADPGRALELTDRDARLYPSGALAQEREVIAIQALLGLGRADEARARGARFSQVFAGSAYAPRIAQLLDSSTSTHNR
ncbi:MAG TPA: hypothetical protein VK762_17845 [Polyangiaceae bacterium]|jgi:hypothetical protein|nr:hypothetical protein [Polyangiaceae bacterium]